MMYSLSTFAHSDLGIDMWQLLPFSRGNVTISVSRFPFPIFRH